MRLSDYGGRIVTTDGLRTVELRDPNDGSRSVYQYRRSATGIERRVLTGERQPFRDTGSPWEQVQSSEIVTMYGVRGNYHPILDEL